MRQIRSALTRLSDRLGLRHAGHPVIAASCAVLSVAALAEYAFSMAARVTGTATVHDIVLALAVLAGLVGGMFRPKWFLWPALIAGVILMLDVPMVTPIAVGVACAGFLAYLDARAGVIATVILLASTMDGLDPSRSRVMVATVQSLAFYCFPLLAGLLLHVMRQRDHDSYLLQRQREREDTARSLHDTISNNLAYLILRIDHAGTNGMPADEHEYRRQLDELRDAAGRAMGHTHEVIDSLEGHTPAQAGQTPDDENPRPAGPAEADTVSSQRAGLQSLIDEEEARLEALGFTGDNLLAEPHRPLTPETMRLLAGLLAELYANIAKHADPGEWYAICVTFDTDAIHISASDTITPDDTKLGLGSGLDRYRTIIETRGGTFQTHTEQAHWQLDISIPG